MSRTWRFVSILLVALSMGMAFCHALELPAKLSYEAPLYLTLQRTLYALFGAPLGASIEVGGMLSAIVFALLARRTGRSFLFAAAGAGCMAAAQVVWWIWVNPANAALGHMAIQAPTPDWVAWRNQWEFAHLIRFALEFCGFVALLLSALGEERAERRPRASPQFGQP